MSKGSRTNFYLERKEMEILLQAEYVFRHFVTPFIPGVYILTKIGIVNHGDNDLGFSPAPNAAACMDRCAAMTNCVRAIFSDTQGLCYLRTHGNKDTPITVDQYDSFHLVEDACGNQGGTPVDPPVDPPTTTDTSTPPPTTAPADDDINSCPNANGKTKVIDGIEYEFFCNKSFSTSMGVDKTTDADNMEDCVKQCCKFSSSFCYLLLRSLLQHILTNHQPPIPAAKVSTSSMNNPITTVYTQRNINLPPLEEPSVKGILPLFRSISAKATPGYKYMYS